jgi:hypothetical protein
VPIIEREAVVHSALAADTRITSPENADDAARARAYAAELRTQHLGRCRQTRSRYGRRKSAITHPERPAEPPQRYHDQSR